MAAAVARVQQVMAEGRYLHLPYTTLFEYLAVSWGWGWGLGRVSARAGAHVKRVWGESGA